MTFRVKILLAALALTVVAVGCADATQPAIEVNGVDISRSDVAETAFLLEPPLDAFGNPTNAAGAEFDTDGAVVVADGRSSAVVVLIENALLAQRLEQLGEEVSPEDRGDATGQAEQFLSGPTIRFREDARDFIIDVLALRSAVTRVTGSPVAEEVAVLVADADIAIDPRYGTWDPDLGYVPPGLDLNG